MNKSIKVLVLGLIFAVGSAEAAITRGDLEAIGSVLREAKEIKGLNDDFDRYVLDPISALGEFLWNLDILEPEVTNSLKGLKSFRLLASCSKVPSDYLTLSEAELKTKLTKPADFNRAMTARRECPKIACTGDRMACVIQALQLLSKFLTSVEKTLFGYYKADGKSYLLCPEGKGCGKVPGVSEIVLGISQQQQIYNDVLKPKVQVPLAKVINILNKLEEILTRLKSGRQPELTPSMTTKTEPSVPAAPAIPAAPPIIEKTTIPEAPELGEITGVTPRKIKEAPAALEANIPEAPNLEPEGIPAAPPLEEISGLKPAQKPIFPAKKSKQPPQEKSQQPSIMEELSKKVKERGKAQQYEEAGENWETK